ncbi:MAG: type I glyceraldehyde-3-phosphate dehydrogenase [Candidatus Micrarchaeota archaeon]|nr:type I glyceraldehyde-3-phosphate dehydrogenase [Candidatus Micrarchaeota archaeon]
MSPKIAVNGFGRIGKLVVRAAFERGLVGKAFEIAAINDTHDPKLSAHLFKYDSTQGQFNGKVSGQAISGKQKVPGQTGVLIINDYEIPTVSSRDPSTINWGAMDVDVVLECTGAFTDRAGASKHLQSGAKKVLISAPCKSGDADATIVIGVNEEQFDKKKHKIVSIGSCTTNCLAPVAKVLDDSFGIESGFMTTCHAYTNDQLILDAYHKDFRRARAGAINIIPTSTGAAKAIGEVIPKLKGKMDGLALRVPIPVGSINDLTCMLKKEATAEEINKAIKKAAEGKMKGILEYTEDPIVSQDIVHNPASSIFDALSTKVIGKQAKTLAWYDNEWGFSNRMIDMTLKML